MLFNEEWLVLPCMVLWMIQTQRCLIEIGEERSHLGLAITVAWFSGSHLPEVKHSLKTAMLGTHSPKSEGELRPSTACFAICRKQSVMFPSLFSMFAFQDYLQAEHFEALKAVL